MKEDADAFGVSFFGDIAFFGGVMTKFLGLHLDKKISSLDEEESELTHNILSNLDLLLRMTNHLSKKTMHTLQNHHQKIQNTTDESRSYPSPSHQKIQSELNIILSSS